MFHYILYLMVMDSRSFMTIKVSTNGIWSFSYLPWKVLYSWIHTAYLLLCNGSRECVWMCKWQTSECKQRQRSLEWAVSPMKGMWNRVQGQQRSWCSCDNIKRSCVVCAHWPETCRDSQGRPLTVLIKPIGPENTSEHLPFVHPSRELTEHCVHEDFI